MMKTMRSSMKCLIAVFVMAMAFMVTGITSEAAVNDLKQTSDSTYYVKVNWSRISGYYYYGCQIASDPSFSSDSIIEQKYSDGIGTYVYFYGLSAGSTYYVRVGCGTDENNCYENWSSPFEVVTRPDNVSDVKFVDATDNTATIQYSAAPGADFYYIYDWKRHQLIGTTTSTRYTIKMDNSTDNRYRVIAAKKSESGYVAQSLGKVIAVNLLTTKIPTENFGVGVVESSANKVSVTAKFSGTGFEVEMVNAGGSKYFKSVSSSAKNYNDKGCDAPDMTYKQNKYLKYRVRAYVDTDNGRKYGEWSDYRAFCEMNAKYTKGSKKINFKWSKINGTGKIRVQVSTKSASGYKTFKTLSGSTKKVTVKKYGKASLKKNKSYYFRLVPLVKINGKYVASDYYVQKKIKVK